MTTSGDVEVEICEKKIKKKNRVIRLRHGKLRRVTFNIPLW